MTGFGGGTTTTWRHRSGHWGSLLLQNGDVANPACSGIEGVLEAYHRSLRSVQLYGPTNFAPVVNHVAR